MSRSI